MRWMRDSEATYQARFGAREWFRRQVGVVSHLCLLARKLGRVHAFLYVLPQAVEGFDRWWICVKGRRINWYPQAAHDAAGAIARHERWMLEEGWPTC